MSHHLSEIRPPPLTISPPTTIGSIAAWSTLTALHPLVMTDNIGAESVGTSRTIGRMWLGTICRGTKKKRLCRGELASTIGIAITMITTIDPATMTTPTTLMMRSGVLVGTRKNAEAFYHLPHPPLPPLAHRDVLCQKRNAVLEMVGLNSNLSHL